MLWVHRHGIHSHTNKITMWRCTQPKEVEKRAMERRNHLKNLSLERNKVTACSKESLNTSVHTQVKFQHQNSNLKTLHKLGGEKTCPGHKNRPQTSVSLCKIEIRCYTRHGPPPKKKRRAKKEGWGRERERKEGEGREGSCLSKWKDKKMDLAME